jgi:subtilisin family serine protease
MKHIKPCIIWLVAICSWLHVYSQPGTTYYYYYKGEKLYLNLDVHTIAVSYENESSMKAIESFFTGSRIETILPTTEDVTRSWLHPTDEEAESRQSLKTYYTEIHIEPTLSEAEYLQKIEDYKAIPGVVAVSPCFAMNDGSKVGLMSAFCVQLKNADDIDLLYEKAAELNVEVLGYFAPQPLFIFLSSGTSTTTNAMSMANTFYETGLFANTQPVFMNHLIPATNDALYDLQWTIHQTLFPGNDINGEEAWTISKGDPNIKTAIYDMGVELTHPDLQANIQGTGVDIMTAPVNPPLTYPYPFPTPFGPSVIYSAHGTECAGIVAAVQDNTIGVTGIAPLTKVISVSANISAMSDFQEMIGFYLAVSAGADVINCSWSGGAPSMYVDGGIAYALTSGRAGKGTVVVFSAGNNNSVPAYPGNSNPLILCVGAVDECGIRSGTLSTVPQSCNPWPIGSSPGSNYGTEIDVVAGGSTIATTDLTGAAGAAPGDYTTQFGGTSSAAPFVAGTAALMLSVNPNFTVQDVNYFIELTAQKVAPTINNYNTTPGRPNGTWSGITGYGLIDASMAVGFASMALCGTNPANMTVTANVNAPVASSLQTSNSITLSHIVNSGASGRYRAGSAITLTPGFSAVSGSIFSAYIQGCNASPFNKTGNDIEQEPDYMNKIAQQKALLKKKPEEVNAVADEKLTVYPNPNNGSFKLVVNNDSPKIIRIYDVLNNLVLQKETKEQQIGIDISEHASGIYFVHVIYGNTLKVERVLHQK